MKNQKSKQTIKKICVVSLLLAMCVHLFLVRDYAAAEETSQDENSWKTEETTMPTAKRGLRKLIEKDGKIYILGGIKSIGPTDFVIDTKVDIYDTATKEWSTGADLPVPYNHSNIALIGNKIYIIGGENIEGNVVADVYVYNIDENKWDTGSSMPMPCSAASTAVIGDLIYVIDGNYEGSERLVQIYNTKTDSWSTKTIPSSVQKQSFAACHAYDGKIYIIGASCIIQI